ncbi:MAG: efflux RND transporter periplasmic adaptor subunit [Bryobacterales bacterium]|nr:efflux RND transporter periplasmic adaptor subunit [Bryobacterales bacterium]
MKRNLLFLAVLVAGGTAVVYPRLTSSASPGPQSVSAPETKPAQIVAAGKVEPVSEEIQLGSELDGKLRQVLVKEGSRVRRGEVVAILENGDYSARVELAKATLTERQAALERLLNGARQQERAEAGAAVREMEAVLENTRAERARRQTLLARGAISHTEFDLADREYRVALARLDAAKERESFVNADARQDERLRAEAEIAQARARILEAEALLEKTFIRSPIDGVVLRRYLKGGESVSSKGNTPIAAIGDTSRLRVRVDVDETDVARLRLGQPAYVTADAYGSRRFTGRVVQIGQSLGPKNIRTDEPTERVDTKILETLVELDPGQPLPIGLRVDSHILTR